MVKTLAALGRRERNIDLEAPPTEEELARLHRIVSDAVGCGWECVGQYPKSGTIGAAVFLSMRARQSVGVSW